MVLGRIENECIFLFRLLDALLCHELAAMSLLNQVGCPPKF